MKNTKYSHEEAFDPEVEYTISEEWRPIKDFEDLYAVSSKGRVMNLKTGRVLKNMINAYGYSMVTLCKDDGTKPKAVVIHRLVAQAFIPNPDNLAQVNHLDEVKTNNNVENLQWCTASQNTRHSIHQQSCRINQYTLDGEFISQWGSAHEIEREFGYAHSYIIAVCKNKFNQAYGYKWEYADPTQQKRQNISIAALTKDGEYVAEYKSATEAARCLKICRQAIIYCLKGIYKSTHGLRFIYID